MQIPSKDWFNTETDYVKFKYLKKGKQSINIMDIVSSSYQYDAWYNPCTFITGIDKTKLNGSKYGKIEINTSGDSKFPNISLGNIVEQEYLKGNDTFRFSYEDFNVTSPIGLFEMNGMRGGTLICDFKFPINSNITRLFAHTSNCKKIVANFNDIPVSNSSEYIFDSYPNSTIFENFPGVNNFNALPVKNIVLKGLRLSTDLRRVSTTRETLMETINAMQTVTTTQTLTLGSTNLALLTDEDKKIATDKGWTLA